MIYHHIGRLISRLCSVAKAQIKVSALASKSLIETHAIMEAKNRLESSQFVTASGESRAVELRNYFGLVLCAWS